MDRPHDLCRKVFTYTGNRQIAIRAIRECFGLSLVEADEVMTQVEMGIAEPDREIDWHVSPTGEKPGRLGVWLTQAMFGFFLGTIAGFAFMVGSFLMDLLSPDSEFTYILTIFVATFTSGLEGGATTALIDHIRPRSFWKWIVAVVLVSVCLSGLSLAMFPAVALLFNVLRHFQLIEPAPNSSDLTGVVESFALMALCIAAAAPICGELAVRMRSLKNCDSTTE